MSSNGDQNGTTIEKSFDSLRLAEVKKGDSCDEVSASSGVSSCHDNESSVENSDEGGEASAPTNGNHDDRTDAGGLGRVHQKVPNMEAEKTIPHHAAETYCGPRSTRSIESNYGHKYGMVRKAADDNFYPMSRDSRGHCLVFNHENFDSHLKLNTRNGTNKDRDAIAKLFDKMGYKVTVFNDLSGEKVIENLDIFAEETDHSQVDSLVVFFLSHGDEDVLYAKNTVIPQKDLFRRFEADRCPSLAGKPKMFFIQACKGQQLDGGLPVYVQEDGGHNAISLPVTADFFVMYSTVPGYYSWRNTTNGSWFIQSLMTVLTQFRESLDLGAMHAALNRTMVHNFQSNTPTNPDFHQRKQVSSMYSTCLRLISLSDKSL